MCCRCVSGVLLGPLTKGTVSEALFQPSSSPTSHLLAMSMIELTTLSWLLNKPKSRSAPRDRSLCSSFVARVKPFFDSYRTPPLLCP